MIRLLFLLSVLSLSTDLYTTWYALTHFPEHIYEANPLSYHVFSWAGIALGSFIALSYTVPVLYFVSRMSRWVAYIFLSIFIVSHVFATLNNANLITWLWYLN